MHIVTLQSYSFSADIF